VRPADLVAAIAREAGVSGPSIGAVRIWDRHSVVEVPASVADRVIRALSDTTIRGKRVLVRRDREG
jgi:ATP-dependent RNA helicase DeaD